MDGINFVEIILYFAIYSIAGWICEAFYCSVIEKKVVSRGFLAGPYCPIYGFGALAIVGLYYPFAKNLFMIPVLFVATMLVTSVLEYLTSWLIEKTFSIKLWDYSKHKYNIKGRVTLLNSILFGILGIFILYVLHPILINFLEMIPQNVKMVTASLFISGMIIDFVTTLNGMFRLAEKLRVLQNEIKSLDKLAWLDKKNVHESIDKLKLYAAEKQDAARIEIARKIEAIVNNDRSGKRLLTSFKNATHKEFQKSLDIIKQGFSEEKGRIRKKIKESRQKRMAEKRAQKEAVANNEISFAAGINFYKLFWVFFIACVVGYVVETLYCFATMGIIECRQGVIYGPFSQVYGFGAVLMVVVLDKLSKARDIWIFICTAFIGGLFEFTSSLFQEKALGTISWDYSAQNFSFNGRTSLLYMFFWGILGVLLVKEIYPRISRFIERIPNKQGIIISWILVVFMSANILISYVAVQRWTDREKGLPPKNNFEEFLDKEYPDEYLREIYPHMQFQG